MKDIAGYIFCLIWNIFITAGTVYLIVVHDWRMWWLLLVYFFLVFPTNNKNEKENYQTICY